MSNATKVSRRAAGAALVLPLALLVACGGESGGGDADTDAGGGDSQTTELGSIEVANTSPTQPQWVATKYGVTTFGEEFGLDMSLDNFTTFDSHSVATQTVLSGAADVVAGSFVSTLLLAEQGQDFQVFCPYISQDGLVIAGANGVDSLDDLFNDDVRVALDSPGGAAMVAFDAILQASAEDRTSEDIPGQQILESSGLRASAFAAGEVDATIIHERQFNEAATQLDDAVIIAQLYEEVPNFIKEAQAAPRAWLEENSELAANYCASVLTGMRTLKADYDEFKAAVDEFAESDPLAEEELQRIHGWLQDYDFWPSEDGGFSEESVEFMSELAINIGLLESAPAYEDVINREILDRAVELANERS
jgi:ABC-type nitrate/sulfonate/bicarbonate transport system substrate-binding protein